MLGKAAPDHSRNLNQGCSFRKRKSKLHHGLTHWGRITNLCITDSNNALSPGWCQTIILSNAGILLIWPLGTNFNIIHIFSFKKMHLKMLLAKWQWFYYQSWRWPRTIICFVISMDSDNWFKIFLLWICTYIFHLQKINHFVRASVHQYIKHI